MPKPSGAALPEVDPDAHFTGKMGGTFGKDVTQILPQYKRVAVPGFRVAFVTKDSASAQVRASGGFFGTKDKSGASVTVNAALAGVDGVAMQVVVDQAYANFLEQLKLAGREVVPLEELKEFFSGLQVTPSSAQNPFTKEVGNQTLQILSPTGMPLWFIHLESGWSDRGGFDLGNWRRYGEYTKKLNAIVVVPLIVVNFVSMTSSGNQSGMVSSEATAAAIPGMAVRTFSSLYASGSEEGGVQMKKGITSKVEFGSLQEIAKQDNQVAKGIFDALGAFAGLANAGGAKRSTASYVMQASEPQYQVAAQDVLARSTGAFARLFQKYPAK